jgi:hypothetical protein
MANNLDVIAIALGMTIGFVIILMNLTGIWPCDLIHAIDSSPLVNNVNSIASINNLISDTHYWLAYLFRC